MRGREPLKLGFDGAWKFEDLTKSKNFFAKLLHKISLIILAKKIFGVRCTLISWCFEFFNMRDQLFVNMSRERVYFEQQILALLLVH